MSKVATFEFNTDQPSEAIMKHLISLGFDAQVVQITMNDGKNKERSQKPSSLNQKRYLLYLAEHDYRGKKEDYLNMLVQTARCLLEIANNSGICYYRNDLGEAFDDQNTKSIRVEEIAAYPPDMNEPYPTRYFISRHSSFVLENIGTMDLPKGGSP